MAPKKKDVKESKAELAKKQKKAEDLTFGLKNKNKSKKVQQHVSAVHHQLTGSNVSKEKKAAEMAARKKEKALQQQMLILNTMAKGIANKRKEADTPMDRETMNAMQKIDMYVDPRYAAEDQDLDNIQKSVNEATGKTKTMITCKYFLEAAENDKYGWFWVCPNGGEKCIYRHALPLGYVLKKDRVSTVQDEQEEYLDVDIEIARNELKGTGTPVTAETFKVWKEKIEKIKMDNLKQLVAEQESAGKKGKKKAGEEREKSKVTGKDLFSINPDLFVDDDGAADNEDFKEDEEYLKMLIGEEEEMAKEHFRLQDEMRKNAQEMQYDEQQFVNEDLEDIHL